MSTAVDLYPIHLHHSLPIVHVLHSPKATHSAKTSNIHSTFTFFIVSTLPTKATSEHSTCAWNQICFFWSPTQDTCNWELRPSFNISFAATIPTSFWYFASNSSPTKIPTWPQDSTSTHHNLPQCPPTTLPASQITKNSRFCISKTVGQSKRLDRVVESSNQLWTIINNTISQTPSFSSFLPPISKSYSSNPSHHLPRNLNPPTPISHCATNFSTPSSLQKGLRCGSLPRVRWEPLWRIPPLPRQPIPRWRWDAGGNNQRDEQPDAPLANVVIQHLVADRSGDLFSKSSPRCWFGPCCGSSSSFISVFSIGFFNMWRHLFDNSISFSRSNTLTTYYFKMKRLGLFFRASN